MCLTIQSKQQMLLICHCKLESLVCLVDGVYSLMGCQSKRECFEKKAKKGYLWFVAGLEYGSETSHIEEFLKIKMWNACAVGG